MKQFKPLGDRVLIKPINKKKLKQKWYYYIRINDTCTKSKW